ncbi:MAG: TIGR01212 family radical SAM protein [Bacilli bacterium]|nr:TIGR01212 family radical SAM protein [Acholeplasmataceae bacterium]
MKYFTKEKYYHTLNNYLTNKYHTKVFKVSLNGNFTCPNRDGTISSLGCLFCSESGSGDFAGEKTETLTEQFQNVLTRMKEKWPEGKYIAYLQANTNTYAPLDELKEKYEEIIKIDPNIIIFSIATRPDCLSDEVIEYLAELNKRVEIWVELGFQTCHERSAKFINRGYSNEVFVESVNKLRAHNLTTIVHIINGLPNETKEMMIETAKFLNNLDIQGIKIHMLHVMKNTPLGELYMKKPFNLLTRDEYVDVVVNQLEHLRKEIVIHRVTGDAPKDLLIEPTWTLKKFVVLNEIDKLMRKEHRFQGDKVCI